MEKLIFLKEIFDKALSYDIFEINRKTKYVYARSYFYFLAYNNTKLSLQAIGDFCNGKDHATVLHGIKVYHKDKNLSEFEAIIEKVLPNIPKYFFQKPQENLTRQEREIKYLYSNKERLEKQIEILKAKTQPLPEIFYEIPENKIDFVIETKIKPFLIFNKNEKNNSNNRNSSSVTT